MKSFLSLLGVLLFAVSSHVGATSIEGKYTPKDGKTLLIIGQELSALRGYKESLCCPTPGGVTTYLGIYALDKDDLFFGGLGLDNELKVDTREADWGGGPSNAITTINLFPESSLAIGLSLTEDYTKHGLERLAKGEFDHNIAKLAELIKHHSQPVFVRVGYEFDGAWNKGYGNVAQYIAAYRHVADQLRSHKANNAVFVWQSASSPADDYIDGGVEDALRYYPGDDYVDWMAISWFLTPDQQGANKDIPSTQKSLANEIVNFARDRKKPVMIAESSPQGFHIGDLYHANIGVVIDGPSGENKTSVTPEYIWNTWYVPYFDYIESNRDVIRAVAYINTDWDSQPMWGKPYHSGFWGDSRVQANSYILEKWLAQISQPQWLHGGAELTSSLNH